MERCLYITLVFPVVSALRLYPTFLNGLLFSTDARVVALLVSAVILRQSWSSERNLNMFDSRLTRGGGV